MGGRRGERAGVRGQVALLPVVSCAIWREGGGREGGSLGVSDVLLTVVS